MIKLRLMMIARIATLMLMVHPFTTTTSTTTSSSIESLILVVAIARCLSHSTTIVRGTLTNWFLILDLSSSEVLLLRWNRLFIKWVNNWF